MPKSYMTYRYKFYISALLLNYCNRADYMSAALDELKKAIIVYEGLNDADIKIHEYYLEGILVSVLYENLKNLNPSKSMLFQPQEKVFY